METKYLEAQPSMKRPEGPRLFRVLLQVSDLGRSQRFYESLLATRGRKVGGGRVYFQCGPTLLGLLEPSADGRRRIRRSPEPVYFSTHDLEGTYRQARRLGCLSPGRIHGRDPAGEIAVRPWGERSFYAHDPSGNPLCFVAADTLFTGTARQTKRWTRAFRARDKVARRVAANRSRVRSPVPRRS